MGIFVTILVVFFFVQVLLHFEKLVRVLFIFLELGCDIFIYLFIYFGIFLKFLGCLIEMAKEMKFCNDILCFECFLMLFVLIG